MTLEDPFYVVKDEVFKALNKTRGLYLHWQETSKSQCLPNPELEWITRELRNALRSIEWDLEDLEDTIRIVEKNSNKFKIDNKEIRDRRSFIAATKQEVDTMKAKINMNRNNDNDGTACEPLLGEESPGFSDVSNAPKYMEYTQLANQNDSPRWYQHDKIMKMQSDMFNNQDDQLQAISNSVGNLKSVSNQIGLELDEHSVMLDELNADLDNADSKLGLTVSKISRALRMDNDRNQWCAIGILLIIVFVVVILFIIL